ncbi:NAD(P)/FAD-dependent oxidoreductase [Nocardioides sp.]|uniref:NAD(P)/FAD-dependent oxidoreductase n=1 Tax=Nocardioides sp. TaxID=35761 RepID=UPI00352907AC
MSLPAQAEVVVVGGGVMGASIAFHLAEAGVPDVLLVERDTLASGSTSRSAGGVRAQFTDAVNIRLGARSLTAFEGYADRPGGEIDLHQVGYLFLHTDAASWEAAQVAVELQRSLGVPTRALTAGEAAALHPGVVVDDVVGATFHPRDGYCSPENVVHGYARAARAHGATVVTGVEVTGVEVADGEIGAVVTTQGVVRTGTVVCAAGPWSAALGEWAGVSLPVEPLRRQILVTEPLPASLVERFPATSPMTIDAATTFYLHREGPGLLVGMSYAAETPGFHPGVSDAWLPDLMTAMERRAPALLDVGLAHRWAGYYEVTPDHNALIGEAPEASRFLYATGFSGHGFLQGPAVGEVVRDLYLRREPPVDVSSLSADRFARGAVVHEHHLV